MKFSNFRVFTPRELMHIRKVTLISEDRTPAAPCLPRPARQTQLPVCSPAGVSISSARGPGPDQGLLWKQGSAWHRSCNSKVRLPCPSLSQFLSPSHSSTCRLFLGTRVWEKYFGPPGRTEHHKATFGLMVELISSKGHDINILKVLRKSNYFKFYTQLKYHSRE